MTIRLYLDEDSMSHSLAAGLRSRGVDVLTVLEAGLAKAPDEEQLEFATSEGRVIYSFNVQDFYQLHSEFLSNGKSHAGIILCQQQQFSVGEQMRRLLRLMAALSADDMIDRVEFLGAWG
jgi:predicted nuclease of predicted toxin-antitoxin system